MSRKQPKWKRVQRAVSGVATVEAELRDIVAWLESEHQFLLCEEVEGACVLVDSDKYSTLLQMVQYALGKQPCYCVLAHKCPNISCVMPTHFRYAELKRDMFRRNKLSVEAEEQYNRYVSYVKQYERAQQRVLRVARRQDQRPRLIYRDGVDHVDV